jgi:hypothetical protein
MPNRCRRGCSMRACPQQRELLGFEWRLLWQQSLPHYIHSFEGYAETVHCAVFSPNGRLLATAGQEGRRTLTGSTDRAWEPTVFRFCNLSSDLGL